ncbi:MAG TPA: endonuclease IV, partial [Ruminococcaceae bacterium]|nr:endonuclease IV [Oscillospiraceae bacterium]
MLKIGCHLSVSKGFAAMGRDAVKIGANTIQFFPRNPRGGKAKALDPDDVTAFLSLSKEHPVGALVAHAPYTLNACSADEKVRAFARMAMREDLE